MNAQQLVTAGIVCLSLASPAAVAGEPVTVKHQRIVVSGVEIFYREAGPADAPVLLLLHGFPSSSFMFRHLMPALADRWRVIAPDYPGFGQSAFPPAGKFEYSFANLAQVMDSFTSALRLDEYALYIQDYGAPIGLRLALRHPERVTALIVQNGNAYEEGLSEGWDPLKAYWREPTAANREKSARMAHRGWDSSAVCCRRARFAASAVQPRHLDARLDAAESAGKHRRAVGLVR